MRSLESKRVASPRDAAGNTSAADEVAAVSRRWPNEFREGARCGFLRRFVGVREKGGYPRGFHLWPLERRNAWFAGFNRGFLDRLRLAQEEAV
jgi:hypothetical protein